MNRTATPYWISLAILLAMAATLLLMGRVPICTCGYVKFWHGVVFSSENSQHLTDWYTPSHVLHGQIFYAALWPVARRLALGWRFLAATVIETAWEILENTDRVIQRYREVTISLDYFGDSVINSTADVMAMFLGFWLAMRLPVWFSIALFLIAEIGVGWAIRDNLTLNVVMLLAPQDWIADWQAAR